MKDFFKIVAPYFVGNQRRYAIIGGAFLIVLSQCYTSFGYFFVQWNRRFYDALEARNLAIFYREILVYGGLAVLQVFVYSCMQYHGKRYAIHWRIWMTQNALEGWARSHTHDLVEGSDQRIQEDLMRFTLLFERFFLEIFNAFLLILLLTPMIFVQTKGLKVFWLPLNWVIFGVTILYTGFGMLTSARIANPLINLEYNSQKTEAEFRYNLVHVRDGAKLDHGFFNVVLHNLTGTYEQIYRRQTLFTFWQKAYYHFSFLIPYVLLAPNYFMGLLTLGTLMQIRATFNRIRNSMAYLFDNYTQITEMLAIARRVSEFYSATSYFDTKAPIAAKTDLAVGAAS